MFLWAIHPYGAATSHDAAAHLPPPPTPPPQTPPPKTPGYIGAGVQ